MTVTIKLPPELESRLRKQAANVGVDAEAYVLKTLESDPRRVPGELPSLSTKELRLPRDINVGLPPEFWARYRKLTRRRQTGKLTRKERSELIALCDQVEMANANRLKLVIDYAMANGKLFKEVMKEFQICELANV